MKQRIKYLLILTAALFLLASCSYVFDGGVTGTVKDAESDSGIEGVNVYLYLSESDRDSDYSDATAGNNPSRYSRQTSTGTGGTFSVDKILWKTSSSSYGKTADETNIYLLMYKSEYGVNGWFKNTSTITIASDSANSSVYSESFTKTKDSKTVTLTITDVAGSTSVGNYDVTLTVTGDYASQCTVVKNSTLSYDITYPKNVDTGDITLSIKYVSDDSPSIWKACYNNDTDYGYQFISDSTVTESLASSIELYVKTTRFSWPTVTGVYKASGETQSGTNNVNVYLYNGNELLASDTTSSTYSTDGTETSRGNFTLTPGSTDYWYSTDYTGKYASYPTDADLKVTIDSTETPIALTGIDSSVTTISAGTISGT